MYEKLTNVRKIPKFATKYTVNSENFPQNYEKFP